MIRAAVVGANGVGNIHVAALRRLGVPLVGVLGSSGLSTRKAAERLDVQAFSSIEEMVTSRDVDVVHACTPNGHHADVVLSALAHGKHVICEKPLAASAAEAEAMAAAAASAATRSTVCYSYRYSNLMPDLAALARGKIGRVRAVRASYLQNWRLSGIHGWRADPQQTGKSAVLNDIGTHLIDLVEHVLQERVGQLNATFDTQAPARDCVASCIGRTETNALLSLNVSQASPAHSNSLTLEVDGESGSVKWHQAEIETLRYVRNRDTQAVLGHPKPGGRHGEFWSAGTSGAQRFERLLAAFYAGLGHEVSTDFPDLGSLPAFDDAARHVYLGERAWLNQERGVASAVPFDGAAL